MKRWFLLTFTWILFRPVPVRGQETAEQSLSNAFLKASGLKAGLCVHLGCGDGRLTAALARGKNFLVHGLTSDQASAEKARRYLQSQNLCGQVSVETADFSSLPYADNLVNLIVADALPELAGARGYAPLMKEIMRVLCPNGLAFLGQRSGATGPLLSEKDLKKALAEAEIKGYEILAQNGIWAKIQKPRPREMDEWTHRGHDAGSTFVSQDEAIGQISGVRWVAGPYWPLGWRKDGNAGMVTTNGRNFYKTFNWASTLSKTPLERYEEWYLVARDAHNGLPLWVRPFKHSYASKWTTGEGALQKNLVAVEDRVYAVLDGDVVACDAATGNIVTHFEKKSSPKKLLVDKGLLIVVGNDSVRSFDAATGKSRWKYPARPDEALIGDGSLFLTTDNQRKLASLDVETGKEHWRKDVSSWFTGNHKKLFYCKGGVLVFTWGKRSKGGLHVASAKDGKHLWSRECAGKKGTRWLFLFLDGLIWVQSVEKGKEGDRWQNVLDGFDPLTGERKRRFGPLARGVSGGCCPNVATESYFLSTRPLTLFRVRDGKTFRFAAGRHPCKSGFVVGNGLIYSMPHGCGKCVGTENLRGFIAFAPQGSTGKAAPSNEWGADFEKRLQKGRAFGKVTGSASSADPESEWPTFRHDPQRSGSTRNSIPNDVRQIWEISLLSRKKPAPLLTEDWIAKPLGGDLMTCPVVAEGMVLVSLVDAHRVLALDAESGEKRWSYPTGGRLDTPPTIHNGLCLFGSRDGWVYCLRMKDGELVWRFRAAPEDRRIVAFGQLESLWPVVGGVLVDRGLACFLAGRSSDADGGMAFYAADLMTGKIVEMDRNIRGPGDILVSDGSTIRIAENSKFGFTPKSKSRSEPVKKAYLRGMRPLLDRSWHAHTARGSYLMNRNYRHRYTFGDQTGQLIVGSTDKRRVFAFRFKGMKRISRNKSIPVPGGTLTSWEGESAAWSIDIPEPFQIESMVLAENILIIGGPSDKYHREGGGTLRMLSAKDGKTIRELKLDTAPVPEGMAAAGGRLYVSTYDGKLLCFGKSGGHRPE